MNKTLNNEAWLRANEAEIKEVLPDTWTHIANLSMIQIGFKLKLLGIDWRSEEEFGSIMARERGA